MSDNGTTATTKNPHNGATINSTNTTTTRPKSVEAAAKLPKLIIPDSQRQYNDTKIVKTKPAKKKRRDKSDLGENFVAPDGGWGWFVSIASGINIVSR